MESQSPITWSEDSFVEVTQSPYCWVQMRIGCLDIAIAAPLGLVAIWIQVWFNRLEFVQPRNSWLQPYTPFLAQNVPICAIFNFYPSTLLEHSFIHFLNQETVSLLTIWSANSITSVAQWIWMLVYVFSNNFSVFSMKKDARHP